METTIKNLVLAAVVMVGVLSTVLLVLALLTSGGSEPPPSPPVPTQQGEPFQPAPEREAPVKNYNPNPEPAEPDPPEEYCTRWDC